MKPRRPSVRDAIDAMLLVEVRKMQSVSRADRGAEGPGDEPNTYGLPDGRRLRAELIRWFQRQRADVLSWVPPGTAPLPGEAPDLARDTPAMAEAMAPILAVYWDDAGQQAREHLGLDPDDWRVTSPKLRSRIDDAAFAFAESTNRATSLQLDAALRKLRAELAAGLVDEGESIAQLTKRVQSVFEQAETWRARRIAATEASRATHAAEQLAAEEAGVVAGWQWLISDDACPLCKKVAAEAPRVKAGDAFATIGDHPVYKDVRHPPLHPGCQCSVVPVLLPQFGGPARPDWSPTLVQPKAGPDYTPPADAPDPRPRPAADKAWPKPTAKPEPTPTPKPALEPEPKPTVPEPRPGPEPPPEVLDLGADPAKAQAKAEALAAEWRPALTDAEREAVQAYKSNAFKSINGYLRGTQAARDPARMEARVAAIDAAIAKGVTPEAVAAYRGVNDAAAIGLDLARPASLAGAEIADRAYVSASLGRAGALDFALESEGEGAASAILRILVPRGARAGYPEGMGVYKEAEIVLPRGSRFRVIEVSEPAKMGSRGRKVYTVTAELIP